MTDDGVTCHLMVTLNTSPLPAADLVGGAGPGGAGGGGAGSLADSAPLSPPTLADELLFSEAYGLSTSLSFLADIFTRRERLGVLAILGGVGWLPLKLPGVP